MITLERFIGRERATAAFGMAALVALCWAYLWTGAGSGMPAMESTTIALFPHRLPAHAGAMEPSLPIAILMWWTMMIAMMTPSAAPLVLLHLSVLRRRQGAGGDGASAAILSLSVLAGYLTAWLAFSVCAASLQTILQPTGLISSMMLWSKSAALSATVLLAAGLYQFSPIKRACLRQCRSPARFLAAHWRPGMVGGFTLGARHGTYCVGCCWLLMALLFVGGIMNLAWIGALSLLVFVEKVLPRGTQVARASGIVLIAWAGATMLV